MSHIPRKLVALEPEAEAFINATSAERAWFELGPSAVRRIIDAVQNTAASGPAVQVHDRQVSVGPSGHVPIRILRPFGTVQPLPVILYLHGGGWVCGNTHTHDRLIRELAVGAGAALVFPSFSLAPEARYPVALEQTYAVLKWVAERGHVEEALDGLRIAVAGDSTGATMATALALMAKQHLGPRLAAQVLFYPVTDARCDTLSYHEFDESYFLSRAAMRWCWNQYTTDEDERAEVTASPLRATTEQLAGLPPALLITAEADVLRDEGEAYGRKLRRAGVEVSATRYGGVIHDFVMLDDLRPTQAAAAAIQQATTFLGQALQGPCS